MTRKSLKPVTCNLKPACVFRLRTHSDVVKLVVAKETAGVADVAPGGIENILPARFGRRQRTDLSNTGIEGRPI